MMGDKIKRNICLVMFVLQSLVTVRYVIDILFGGDTEWWQPLADGIIAATLFVLFDKYRKRTKKADV